MRITNPATDSALSDVAEDTRESISAKFTQAARAQKGWAARPFAERAATIRRFAELVTERRELLARTLTSEMGKPITQSANELGGLSGRIEFFLAEAERTVADELLLGMDAGGTEERIRHEPLGVIANVSAWNYPFFVGANVFLPALLTGNAVLYKPSEYATLTGLELERALHDAGVPPEVFAAVVGGAGVGAALLEQKIDGVFFTGSYATGVRIAESLARRMVKVQLELGGKDPAYVCDDVDPKNAALATADGAFYNTGQSCCAVERIYVHEKIWQPFVAAFTEAVRGFRVGDPTDEATYIGPLARRELAITTLEAQVADALEKGAKVLVGGKRSERAGFFFEPTVLVDVTHEMSVMQEESFGPIIGLAKVSSDEEASALMADTEYGLTAAVYSGTRARAEGILNDLQVGTAYWNCCDRVSPRLPWSGRGHSGIGCTLSRYGIEAFTKPKAYHLRGA
ncbi:MAG: aldehyde dehydrogenase family protein [Myxococcales bacterium]|nr:aldehyde dehydrogenase family protein [Myxococcales bacterium]